ncbi:MAG: coproporphyrinogen III oxidase, partial [Clostridia bacterium]|nr:coproporphyrinogen III oxidase [Clostridia bacterium]
NGELPDSDEVAELYEYGKALLEEKGYYRYEISNFAKKGFESKHNLNYWQRGEYIGFGVSASSFMRGSRFTNTFSLDEYMKCIISGFYPAVTCEKVSQEDAKFEFVMLALRTAKGVDAKEYEKAFGSKLEDDYAYALKKTEKYLEKTQNGYKIKDEYLYVQNTVLMWFMEQPKENV